jgi:hypothetical protein
MKRRRHTPEQIVCKLREADRLLAGAVRFPRSPSSWRSARRPITAGTPTQVAADTLAW